MTFDITGSVFVPFDVVRYADALCSFSTDLSTSYNGILKENNISLGMSFGTISFEERKNCKNSFLCFARSFV